MAQNNLKKLNLSNCTYLNYLGISRNDISEINLPGCVNLEGISAEGSTYKMLLFATEKIDTAYLPVSFYKEEDYFE